jgi:hypothetical protein
MMEVETGGREAEEGQEAEAGEDLAMGDSVDLEVSDLAASGKAEKEMEAG